MPLLRNILLNISGTGLFSVLHMVIGVVLARLLTPSGLGRYSLTLSFVTISATLFSLGVGSASIYAINNQKYPANWVATSALKLSLLMAAVMGILVIPILKQHGYFGEMPTQVIVCVSLYGSALLITESTYPVLIAFFQIGKHTVVRILPGFVLLTLVSLTWYVGNNTLALAFFYTAVGQVFGLCALLWFLRDTLDRSIPLAAEKIKQLVGYGLKLNSGYLMHLLNWEMGLFLVRYFTSDFSEVGYYRIGIRFGGILLLVGNSIGPLLYSKWSLVEGAARRQQAETVCRIFCFILVFPLLLLELFAGWIIPSLYGPEYMPAVSILRIILVGIGARFLMVPLIEIFSSGGKPLLGSLAHGVSLISMVFLMAFLVPDRSGVGASIAFAVSNCIGLVACYLLVALQFRIDLRRCFLITREDLMRLTGMLRSLHERPA